MFGNGSRTDRSARRGPRGSPDRRLGICTPLLIHPIREIALIHLRRRHGQRGSRSARCGCGSPHKTRRRRSCCARCTASAQSPGRPAKRRNRSACKWSASRRRSSAHPDRRCAGSRTPCRDKAFVPDFDTNVITPPPACPILRFEPVGIHAELRDRLHRRSDVRGFSRIRRTVGVHRQSVQRGSPGTPPDRRRATTHCPLPWIPA